jgi:protein translocase SEC61 complex gamma subunit, archaeal and eukaryotic
LIRAGGVKGAGSKDRGRRERPRREGSGLRERWESVIRVFRYSRKPGGDEYALFLRVVGLALLVVGGIAFIIHLIATVISGAIR